MRTKLRFLLPLGLAAGMALCLRPAAAQPSVYSGAFNGNEGGLTSAADWQAVTNFVLNAQKDVSIINNFQVWTSGTSTNGTISFPTTEMNNIRGHGSIPLYTWQPECGGAGVTQSFNCASIAAGNYDAFLTTWATAAKNWGHPFFLRFAHEMNGTWYPWCAGTNGNTSALYVQMWQHVHDLFTQVGATNVTWVWCVNTVYSGSTPLAGFYPGDNYVDWISFDSYNRLDNSWQDFAGRSAATIIQLTNIAPGKPIMVAETGCNQNPNYSKSQWFLNALTNYLPLVQPRIKAWVYENATNTNDGNDWQIMDPASAAAGYQQGIGLTYYASNQYEALATSPIPPLLNDATTTDTMPPFVSIVSPATDLVATGRLVQFVASAADKSGIAAVVFSLNGLAQQTNLAPPYQFSWLVPGGGAYTIAATAYDNAGNRAASTIQVVAQDAGVVTLTNSDAYGASSFNTAGNWDSGQAPDAGTDYLVGSGYALRTPADNSAYTFAGDTLILSGTFYFKQTNVVSVADLWLTNGLVENFNTGGTPNTGRLAGNIKVVSNATIDAGANNGGASALQILAALSGNGGLTFIRPSTVTLSAANTYNGPVTIAGSTLILDSAASLTPASLTLSNYVYGGSGYNVVSNLVLAGGSLNVGSGPAGVLRVGYRTAPGTNCVAVLDVSSQSNFTVNLGEFSVGNNLYNDGFTTLGTVYLATNNSVTATNLTIGYSAFTGGGNNVMVLGAGSNYFNTPLLTVGGQKEGGQLSLPAGGVFRLDGGAARADLTVGGQNFSTSVSCTGMVDFSGGVFLGALGTLSVGQKAGGNTGGASGTLVLSSNAANNVSVNLLVIGDLADATGGAPAVQGTLTLNGGRFLVNSNVTLASFSGGIGSATGTLNLNGGTFAVAGDIVDGGGASTLNVSGGWLEMKPAGAAGAGSITVDSLRLNGVITNAGSVTVANLSGSGTLANQTGVTTVSNSTAPGAGGSLGVLTAGSLALSGSTVLKLNRTNSPGADRLAASSIVFGGTLTVTNVGGPLQAGDSFQLFSGALRGGFAATNLPALSATNLHWDVSQLLSQGVIQIAASPAAPPILAAPYVIGTNFSVRVTAAQAGWNYVLQASPALVPAAWTGLQTNAGNGGPLDFAIPVTPLSPQQFFRVCAQ